MGTMSAKKPMLADRQKKTKNTTRKKERKKENDVLDKRSCEGLVLVRETRRGDETKRNEPKEDHATATKQTTRR